MNLLNIISNIFRYILIFTILPQILYASETNIKIPLKLDQEELMPNGQALNPSTQSINRYFSVMRELDHFSVKKSDQSLIFNCELRNRTGTQGITLNNIDLQFLIPILPYDRHRDDLSLFDEFNLMLAEYARIGVSIPHHEKNDILPFFNTSNDLFREGDDYFIDDNSKVIPNDRVWPLRIQLINNCLKPGLWEITASDTVGEMFHAWGKVPFAKYAELVKSTNNLSISNRRLKKVLKYKKSDRIPLELNRLRTEGSALAGSVAQVAIHKKIGSYSSQDSRRKVQQQYFRIFRDNKRLDVTKFGELIKGDLFKLSAFVAPGIYTTKNFMSVSYNPGWQAVEISTVRPLTYYDGGKPTHDTMGHLEIKVYTENKRYAIIVGNIPIELLVFQDDYRVSAFGVGVFSSSELSERRHLRKTEGPNPHYAYLAECGNDGQLYGLNNHEHGLEQIYLRPFTKNQDIYLRFTIVSYERITDLLELEFKVSPKLANLIRKASKNYRPPLFRVYTDSGVL